MTAVDVKYRLDNILHSFKSWFLDRSDDNLFLSLPEAVLRYQIRRFDRVNVPEDRDLEVKFNLMPQKTLVKDISLGGMGIQTDLVPKSFDRDIRLNSIKLMLKKNQTLHLSGILRYIRSIDDNDKQHYRIGVEFDPLKEDDKSTLLDLLDDLET
jgi:c-di-GMP-binding flagellar brake protein YcgR